MRNYIFYRELRVALLLLLGLAMGMAAGLPLAARLVPQSALQTGTTSCPARAAGSSCVLCGMTTAVYALTDGHFAAARTAHPAALPLIGLAWAGSFLIICSYPLRRLAPRVTSVVTGGNTCRSSV